MIEQSKLFMEDLKKAITLAATSQMVSQMKLNVAVPEVGTVQIVITIQPEWELTRIGGGDRVKL